MKMITFNVTDNAFVSVRFVAPDIGDILVVEAEIGGPGLPPHVEKAWWQNSGEAADRFVAARWPEIAAHIKSARAEAAAASA